MAFVVAFVVGVTPTKWARIWNERMPRSPLVLRLLSTTDAMLALETGQADVALLRDPFHGERLSVIQLYLESPVVVLPRNHPIEDSTEVSLLDLGEHNLLQPGDGRGGDCSQDEWTAVMDLVATGVGIAIMPQSIARALGRKDVVARPMADAAATRIALVWQKEKTTADVEQFIGIVRGRSANSSRGVPTPPQPKASRRPPGAARKKPGLGRGR